MFSLISRSGVALVLFLAIAMTAMLHLADRASAAGQQIAGVSASTPDTATPRMTPMPRMAQGRCPGGQLVFLSRACGCNGACCLCSRQTPYLNHCTCRCEAVPTPCARGHSAGNP